MFFLQRIKVLFAVKTLRNYRPNKTCMENVQDIESKSNFSVVSIGKTAGDIQDIEGGKNILLFLGKKVKRTLAFEPKILSPKSDELL